MTFRTAINDNPPVDPYEFQRERAEEAVLSILSVFNLRPDLEMKEGVLALETAVEALIITGATWDMHPEGCV